MRWFARAERQPSRYGLRRVRFLCVEEWTAVGIGNGLSGIGNSESVIRSSIPNSEFLENVTIERRGRKGRKVRQDFLCGLRGLCVPSRRRQSDTLLGWFPDRGDFLVQHRRRDDSVLEIRHVELFVRRVRVLVGQSDAEQHRRQAKLLLER